MREATVYIAVDGTTFNDPQDARERDELVAIGQQVDSWLTGEDFAAKKITEYRRVIVGWEAFKKGVSAPQEDKE